MKYTLTYYFQNTIHKIFYRCGLITKDRYLSRRAKYRNRYKKVNSKQDAQAYVDDLVYHNYYRKLDFVPISNDNFERNELDTKIIAWYLPQYHQIDINNRYHGQGFTEWTNVTQAIPGFKGHYQPHLPYDVGFYDLLNPDTFKRQIYLAKKYGIYGFCFHWYWFSGRRIMEKPLELFLAHPEYNFNFCINWANENWSTLWDGGNKELIFEQKLDEDDDKEFFNDILPYIRDSRYIKINGKPLISIYRPKIFTKQRFKILLSNWRALSTQNGFPGLYILITNSFDFDEDPKEWGADGIVEFPPFGINANRIALDGYVNPFFKSSVFNLAQYCDSKSYFKKLGGDTVFRSALIGFDNTARKGFSSVGSVFFGQTPSKFKTWLKDIIFESKYTHSQQENIIFINSWNEWAEGSHLEPDLRNGYAYLQAVKEALEESRKVLTTDLIYKKAEVIPNVRFIINSIESLGDVIASEPIVRHLKFKYPHAKVTWIVLEQYTDVVKDNPYIDEVVKVGCLHDSDVWIKKNLDDNDVLVDCHFNNRQCSQTKKFHQNLMNPIINAKTYFYVGGLLESFCLTAGLPPLRERPKIWLAPNVDAIVEKIIPGKYVVIHTQSSLKSKDWQVNKWREVVNNLIANKFYVVEVGLKRSLKIDNLMFIEASKFNLSLQESFAIVKHCVLFIGIDSSFAHVANAFDIPSIVLLGDLQHFVNYSPFSNESRNRIVLRTKSGMVRDIDSASVMNSANRILRNVK